MSTESQVGKLILIYGGSFDPPHRAHVQLPAEAAKIIGADKILYIPAGRPPHKSTSQVTDGTHRLQMLRLALDACDQTSICDWELQRDEPSYTAHTLEHLRGELGDEVEMRLLIGADMASMFYQWYRPDLILELAEPLVVLRPPQTEADIVASLPDHLSESERDAWRQRIVHLEPVDVSSTDLRQHIAAGNAHADYVTANMNPSVLKYIEDHRLYRADA
jgi:nicotinate-nucleotide adenylyltransferase